MFVLSVLHNILSCDLVLLHTFTNNVVPLFSSISVCLCGKVSDMTKLCKPSFKIVVTHAVLYHV